MSKARRSVQFPIGELAAQNPWWSNPGWHLSDIHLKAQRNSRVPWNPRLAYWFEWNKDLVYTLRGPRQIGKTTLLKQLIFSFLKKGLPQDHIFFLNCENLDRRQDLVEALTTYLNTVRGRSSDRAVIFLDEVSAIVEWQRAVKFLADTGNLTNVSLILTGSHSMDLKASSELLPGRRGQGASLDKLLVPMKFSEFVETLDSGIGGAIKDNNLLQQAGRLDAVHRLSEGDIPDNLMKLAGFLPKLEGYFQQYLITGGVPPAIDDYLKQGLIPESRYRDYVNAVLGDMRKYGKREGYVRQVLTRIIEVSGTTVSWNSIKKQTDIPHHQTVAEYVDALKDNYTLSYLYRLDINKKAPSFEDDKKIYIHDPFIFHALRGWTSGRNFFQGTFDYLRTPENNGHLAESILCDHLIRVAYAASPQKDSFDPMTSLFYWRTNKGREIDFVLLVDAILIPIESKYQDTMTSDDLFAIAEFNSIAGTKSGIILSKDLLEKQRNAVVIPTPLFLLLV